MRNGQTDFFATGVYVDRIRDEAGRLREQRRLWHMINEGDAWRLYPGAQREAMEVAASN